MKKKIYLILSILLLVLLTACGKASIVTPTEATLPPSTNDSAQTDTFIVSTENIEETVEPTAKSSNVTVSGNVTVERNENSNTPNTSNTNIPTTPTPTTKPAEAIQTNKTWYNTIYDYIEHPAETKEIWVVDEEAHTVEKPIYGDKEVTLCDICGADITSSVESHQHDDGFTYHTEIQSVVVGYETVEIPEQGHYETVVIKEAWTEKVLVKEAGYY